MEFQFTELHFLKRHHWPLEVSQKRVFSLQHKKNSLKNVTLCSESLIIQQLYDSVVYKTFQLVQSFDWF